MYLKGTSRIIGYFLILFLSACDTKPPPKPYSVDYSDAIMGTTFNVKVSQLPDGVEVEDLKQDIKTRLDDLNATFSTYDKQSELSAFNQSEIIDWYPVSQDLAEVLQAGQKISAITEGAFDITVAPLVNLWGFGADKMRFETPAAEKIEALRQEIGYQHLQVDLNALQIKKDIPQLSVDLSSIAKGYAVDKVGLLLESLGIEHYLVEIGGELRLKGLSNRDKAWNIAIEKPTAEKRMMQKVIAITDKAMATSGDYRNFFEVDGVRYSHTIDPRNGYSIKHNLASVTILSHTAMQADALATGFMVLGADKAFQLAQQHHIAALFILKTNTGFEEKASSAWTQVMEGNS